MTTIFKIFSEDVMIGEARYGALSPEEEAQIINTCLTQAEEANNYYDEKEIYRNIDASENYGEARTQGEVWSATYRVVIERR